MWTADDGAASSLSREYFIGGKLDESRLLLASIMIRSSYTVPVPEMSIQNAIFRDLEQKRDTTALVNGETDESFTYQEVYGYMRALGSALSRHGVKKGDVVALFATNSPEYYIACLGIWSIGAVVTGLNFNYTTYEVSNQVNDSDARVIFAMEKNVATAKKVMETSKTLSLIITIDKAVPGCVYIRDLMRDAGSSFPSRLHLRPRDDLACIMYSSGTTGLPKGVMLTHYNLMAGVLALTYPGTMRPYPAGEQRTGLAFLPMFHIYGCMMIIVFTYMGGKIITLPSFNPDVFLGTIQKYKIRELSVVPPVIVFLAKSPLVSKYDISSVDHVVAAAAPLTEDTEREFLDRFSVDSIYQGYGMTEVVVATVTPYGKPRPGSSGILLANTEAKIISTTSGAMLGVGEEGEICLRGPQRMKGYHKRPEATAAMIDKLGWLYTGDVGYYDKDGYFFITGRIKELIKHKGFQVAPAELEGLLLRHPAVADAAVIGVEDQSAGELPRAFIVRRSGVTVSEQEIYNFIKDRLSRHKWLSGGVQFVASIPKTASGKIIRRDLKKMLVSSKL